MKVIFVFAHPDDESISSGGTIAKLVKEGVDVKLITATKGEKGRSGLVPVKTEEELGIVRENELKEAAKVLGISKIYFLGFRDGELKNISKNEIESNILKILKEEKPDIVVTFNKEGGSRHPDHIQISKSTTKAFEEYLKFAPIRASLYYSETKRSFIEKLRKQGMDYRIYGKIKGTQDSLITTTVDISDTLSIKIAALKCHLTQKKDWERYLKRKKYKEFKQEFFRLIKENYLA